MIYTSVDYIQKYYDVMSYIISRALHEKYSPEHIERTIAYSSAFLEFESSNITQIAFSSYEFIYSKLFPESDNTEKFELDVFGVHSWVGMSYMYLFFKYKITFEQLFALFPIEYMLEKFKIYHEMSFSHLTELYEERMKTTPLDLFMTKRMVKSTDISRKTGIPLNTIKSLRYKERDISKFGLFNLMKIANELNIRPESLLFEIPLKLDKEVDDILWN